VFYGKHGGREEVVKQPRTIKHILVNTRNTHGYQSNGHAVELLPKAMINGNLTK
jgi:hypothetical protein